MTTTFSVTRDEICTAALKECGALETKQIPDPDDLADVAQSLNIIIKSWVKGGMPLWKVVEVTFPVVVGLREYPIGTTASGIGSIVTDRPLRILNAFIRTESTFNDTDLIRLSREEYEQLGAKFDKSVPNSYYYQPLIPNGLFTLWPTASSLGSTIHIFTQIPISDADVGTSILDFPSECYQALKWNLCAEICGPYTSSIPKIQRIEQKAAKFKEEMESWSVEEGSVYFGMDYRGK